MKKPRLATTTIRLDEQDKQIIATIKAHYGVKSAKDIRFKMRGILKRKSFNDAIRLALRETLPFMFR